MTTTTMDFEIWRQAVDELVWRRAGCGLDDLPDCAYRDWYDDGVSPARAAARALTAAQE